MTERLDHILLNQVAIMRCLDIMARSFGVHDPALFAMLNHRLHESEEWYRREAAQRLQDN
jgi:hypothetical protein